MAGIPLARDSGGDDRYIDCQTFNVGSGFSGLLELRGFGPIAVDSYRSRRIPGETYVEFPSESAIQGDLKLLAWTHPHHDHTLGISKLARKLQEGGAVLLPPIPPNKILDLFEARDRARGRTHSLTVQLRYFCHELLGKKPRIIPCRSDLPPLRLCEKNDYWISFIGPTPEIAAEQRALIDEELGSLKDDNVPTPRKRFSPHLVNAAFGVHIGDPRKGGPGIFFSGDMAREGWGSILRQFQSAWKGSPPRFPVVMAPHHGSRRDNSPALWKWLATNVGHLAQWSVLSASGGQYHPSIESLRTARNAGAIPACTNLKGECRDSNKGPEYLNADAVDRYPAEVEYAGDSNPHELESLSPPVTLFACHGSIRHRLVPSGHSFIVKNQASVDCPYDPYTPAPLRQPRMGMAPRGRADRAGQPAMLQVGTTGCSAIVCDSSSCAAGAGRKLGVEDLPEDVAPNAQYPYKEGNLKAQAQMRWLRRRKPGYGPSICGVTLNND